MTLKFIRTSIISRAICFLLAFHIFNLSVDTKDVEPDYVPEDLSINDQETIVELILEKIIGIDDAIQEQDEPDQEDGGVLDFKKINLISYLNPKIIIPVYNNFNSKKVFERTSFHESPTFETLFPPPQS
jgi:hypothetical protein